jgi:membrane protease YdiL (CAAX protease family)
LEQNVDQPVPAAPSLEPAWRLALRLGLDALGCAVFSSLFAAAPLAAAGLAIVAAKGLQGASDAAVAWRDVFANADSEGRTLVLFVFGGASYLAVILGFLAVARLRRGRDWRAYVAWTPFRFEKAYWLLGAAGIVWGVAAGSLIEHAHPEAKNWVSFPSGVVGSLVTVALVAVLGPLCEELVFRGWLFTALRARLNAVLTILATAALFAAAHWESTHLYALAVFPIGLLLGYARERGGSIKGTFAFHGIYNFAGWILALFAGR